jgi:hypothetical protein
MHFKFWKSELNFLLISEIWSDINCPKREILNKIFENHPNFLIIPSDKNKSVNNRYK